MSPGEAVEWLGVCGGSPKARCGSAFAVMGTGHHRREENIESEQARGHVHAVDHCQVSRAAMRPFGKKAPEDVGVVRVAVGKSKRVLLGALTFTADLRHSVLTT